MKNTSLVTWIRTIIFLFLLIFVTLGGDFLYTGEEYYNSVDNAVASQGISDSVVLEQHFVPRHSYLSGILIAVQEKPEEATGNLVFQLFEQDTDELLYELEYPVSAITERWYLNFEVNQQLNTQRTYYFTVSLQGNDAGNKLSLCMVGADEKLVENGVCVVRASEAAPQSGKELSGGDVAAEATLATGYQYNVIVPLRLALFVGVLAAILLGMVIWMTLSKRAVLSQRKEITFGEVLEMPVFGTGHSLIEVGMFAVVTLGAVVLRIAFFSVKSNDYYLCYEPWINDIRAYGGIGSLGQVIGNYPPLFMIILSALSHLPFPPLYLIKLTPCIFDFVLALVGLRFLKLFGIIDMVKRITLYAVLLLNPISLLNSSAWGQCDAVYSVFILLALYGLCSKASDKWYATGDGICLLFGIAFCLKQQAVFFLPVLGLVLITQKRNRLKLVHFLWVPIAYIVSCIPGFLMGRDLKQMFKIYFAQAADTYGGLNVNYPNLYSFIGSDYSGLYDSFFIAGLLIAVFVLLFVYYWIYSSNREVDGLLLCKITTVSTLIVCFFMPSIHERYGFTAEMILLIIMFIDAKYIKVAIVTLFCTLLTYCTYLYQTEFVFTVLPEWLIAVLRFGCIMYIVRDVVQDYRQQVKHIANSIEN